MALQLQESHTLPQSRTTVNSGKLHLDDAVISDKQSQNIPTMVVAKIPTFRDRAVESENSDGT